MTKSKKTSTSKFIELWSPARQQIWPWSRSKVTVKVTAWYHRKGLVTKNTHAKYQRSTSNSAKVMAKVKVFVTDGQTDRRTDRGTDRRTNEIWCPCTFAKAGDKNASKIWLLNGTKNNNTSTHMLLDHCYAFGLSLWLSGLKKFLKEGDPCDLFLPCPGSTPGRIWPKNNNTCKGQWVLHLYHVSSKSIKRFWRRSCKVKSLRTTTTDGSLWQ